MFRAAIGFIAACVWFGLLDALGRMDFEDWALAIVGLAIVAILLW